MHSKHKIKAIRFILSFEVDIVVMVLSNKLGCPISKSIEQSDHQLALQNRHQLRNPMSLYSFRCPNTWPDAEWLLQLRIRLNSLKWIFDDVNWNIQKKKWVKVTMKFRLTCCFLENPYAFVHWSDATAQSICSSNSSWFIFNANTQLTDAMISILQSERRNGVSHQN